MQHKIANTLTIVLFSAVLLSVIGTEALLHMGIDFPTWTGIGQKKTALEGRTYTKMPKPSLSSFQSGDFQDQCEGYLADSLPFRESALVLNARLQGSVISTAALPLGYKAYPTFFDSDIVYNSEDGTLSDMPAQDTPELRKKLESFARNFEGLAESYPQTKFFVMSPPRANYVDNSPLTALVPDAIGQDDVKEILSGATRDSVVIDYPSDYETRLKWFYRTDHHWNMDGAYEGYKAIAEALGFGDEIVEKGGVVYESPLFYGAYARDGLFDGESEVLYDYGFDLPDYGVKINGKEKSMDSLVHDTDKKADVKFSSRYSNRFHHEYAQIQITNPEKHDQSKLLLVGDSFTDCIERLLASHFQTTVVFDPRDTAGNDGTTVSEIIEAYGGFDDVVFLFNSTALSRSDVIATTK